MGYSGPGQCMRLVAFHLIEHSNLKQSLPKQARPLHGR